MFLFLFQEVEDFLIALREVRRLASDFFVEKIVNTLDGKFDIAQAVSEHFKEIFDINIGGIAAEIGKNPLVGKRFHPGRHFFIKKGVSVTV